MSWPWNELGLTGPASLSDIRHAYAERTRDIHPEEDPEGFQRLYEAYQEARRIVRSKQRNTSLPPPEERPKSNLYQDVPKSEQPKTDQTNTDFEPESTTPPNPDKDDSDWDYKELLHAESDSPAPEPPNEQDDWDYKKLLRTERHTPAPEPQEQQDDWDYDRIFAEERQEQDKNIRKDLQERTG